MLQLVKDEHPVDACERLWSDSRSLKMRNLCEKEQVNGILPLEFLETYAPNTMNVIRREHRKHAGKVPFDRGYVYLIHAVGTNFYKIGKSIHPDKRLTQISPKMPFECELIATRKSLFVTEAEKHYHGWLHSFRANGEWFEGIDKGYFSSAPDEVIEATYMWNLSQELLDIFDGAYLQHICGYYFDPLSVDSSLTIARLEAAFNQITEESGDF
jgi:hypothetical protein